MLKKIFFLIVLLAGISRLEAQSWIQKLDLPITNVVGEGTCFSIANHVYIVCGGTTVGFSNQCWAYDVISDTWTRKADFPGTQRHYPNSFAISGFGYLFGGEDTTNGTNNDLWQYNPATNSWLQKASLPGPPRCAAITFELNNKGYVIGGAEIFGVLHNDVWEYDPVTDSWTQKNNMPCTYRAWGVGFSIGSKGYAGLGTTYSIWLRDWWEYEPTTDTWTIKDSLVSSVSDAGSFVLNGRGYVGPGFYSSVARSSFFSYDPIADQWTQHSNFPGTQTYGPYSASCMGKGYIIAGSHGNFSDSATWEFTPPVGIAEYDQDAFSIFPNPATNILNLNYDLTNQFSTSDKIDFIISDLSGKELIRKTIPKNQMQMQIAVSTLAIGMYICRIETENEIFYSRKFSVVRD